MLGSIAKHQIMPIQVRGFRICFRMWPDCRCQMSWLEFCLKLLLCRGFSHTTDSRVDKNISEQQIFLQRHLVEERGQNRMARLVGAVRKAAETWMITLKVWWSISYLQADEFQQQETTLGSTPVRQLAVSWTLDSWRQETISTSDEVVLKDTDGRVRIYRPLMTTSSMIMHHVLKEMSSQSGFTGFQWVECFSVASPVTGSESKTLDNVIEQECWRNLQLTNLRKVSNISWNQCHERTQRLLQDQSEKLITFPNNVLSECSTLQWFS